MKAENHGTDTFEGYLQDLQVILEITRKPFLILDDRMTVLAANQRFFNTFNQEPREVLGMNLYALDNREWNVAALHTLLEKNLLHETAVDDFEIAPVFSRLGQKYLRINAIRYRHAQSDRQITLLSIEDFTRRKLVEEKLEESEMRFRQMFRQMFETSRDGLLLINKVTGIIGCANQTICDFLGVEQHELIEKPFTDTDIWRHETDFEKISAVLETSGFLICEDRLRNLKTHLELDAEITLVNGAVWIQCNVRDIGKLKRAEEEHGKLQSQLFQVQKLDSIGRLAGGISHDFNNLLFVILGHCELLLEETPNEHALRGPLEEVHRAASRARALTGQLLAFSRKQILEMKRADINDVVAEIETLLRRLISEDIELKFNLTPEKLPVEVDASHLEQVLMNLVVNARDAMPNGGTLTIETSLADLDEKYIQLHYDVVPGTYVMLAVSDTGSGMDAETMMHLFEPFFSTKAKEKGTGLGLSTCYGIVRQHGGHIWAYSEPGQGTTFKIYLPLAVKKAKPSMESDPGIREAVRNATVMVVEDNASVRELTCNMLTRIGYRVIKTDNSANALELARDQENPIDLVLTDVVMPGFSGPELYKRILEVHPQVRVLYMSGYTNDIIAHRGVLDEGVHFIQKPFSSKALYAKIRKALESC